MADTELPRPEVTVNDTDHSNGHEVNIVISSPQGPGHDPKVRTYTGGEAGRFLSTPTATAEAVRKLLDDPATAELLPSKTK